MGTMTHWIKSLSIAAFICMGVLAIYYLGVELGIIHEQSPNPRSPGLFRRQLRDRARLIGGKTAAGFGPARVGEWFAKQCAALAAEYKFIPSILFLVVISRLVITLIAVMTLMLIRNQPPDPNSLTWLWSKWDAGHFLDVAKHGYMNATEERFFIVFFPLYPFLIRMLAGIIRSYEWAGVALSNLCLAVAAIYLYLLVKLDFNHRIARNSVLSLLIFPVSFFLGVVYSDSLFLALSIMTIYYARTGKWYYAGLCGCLASLTRNFGVLLLVPVMIEFALTAGLTEKFKRGELLQIGAECKKGLVLLLIPLGLGGYLLINRIVTGDCFTFLTYQREHWSNGFGFFADNLVTIFNNAMNWKATERIALWIPELIAIIMVIAMIFYGFRKIRVSYLIYMMIYLFTCTSATWLISGPRYLMCLFPVHLLIALIIKAKPVQIGYLFLSLSLLAFYTLAFVLDYYVM
jgi:Gpi18-like mannosyltransferase